MCLWSNKGITSNAQASDGNFGTSKKSRLGKQPKRGNVLAHAKQARRLERTSNEITFAGVRRKSKYIHSITEVYRYKNAKKMECTAQSYHGTKLFVKSAISFLKFEAGARVSKEEYLSSTSRK